MNIIYLHCPSLGLFPLIYDTLQIAQKLLEWAISNYFLWLKFRHVKEPDPTCCCLMGETMLIIHLCHLKIHDCLWTVLIFFISYFFLAYWWINYHNQHNSEKNTAMMNRHIICSIYYRVNTVKHLSAKFIIRCKSAYWAFHSYF